MSSAPEGTCTVSQNVPSGLTVSIFHKYCCFTKHEGIMTNLKSLGVYYWYVKIPHVVIWSMVNKDVFLLKKNRIALWALCFNPRICETRLFIGIFCLWGGIQFSGYITDHQMVSWDLCHYRGYERGQEKCVSTSKVTNSGVATSGLVVSWQMQCAVVCLFWLNPRTSTASILA